MRRIAHRSGTGPFPLSAAQRRLWFLDQLEPRSSRYNVSLAARLSGTLDVEALRQALDAVVRRHDVLRTTFTTIDGSPVQIVAPFEPVPLPVTDLGDLPAGARERESERRSAEEARRPFDLARGPLLRTSLLRLGETDHLLVVVMHHIISDGWSRGVLFGELGTLYRAGTEGVAAPLPDLPLQYADFARWQNEWLESEVCVSRLARWGAGLVGMAPVLELPQARPRPATQSYRGAREPILIPEALTGALAGVGRRENATLFMTLLAAFQVLLARYTGRRDVAVGSPSAGRTRAEIEGLIGCFANTLVLRTDLSGDPPFRELLRRVREVALEAYEHQDLPFDKLVEQLRPERSLGYNPLVQVVFNLQNAPRAPLELPGLTLRPIEIASDTARFDLHLTLAKDAGGLGGAFTYSRDLFDADSIAALADHFLTLLQGIVDGPDRRLSELPLLPELERREMLVQWNRTAVDYPRDRCVHQLVEAQAERTPEATALVYEGERLTYAELNRRANRLAYRLRAGGVGPEVRVGLCFDRSMELIVGLLAVLKAGGTYVPLDPNGPPERLARLLGDAGVRTVLSVERRLKSLARCGADVICLDAEQEHRASESDADPASGVTLDHAAYVIYTSGSTGRPKGVVIEHRALLNYVQGVSDRIRLPPGASFAVVQPLTVDACVTALYPPLVTGGSVHLISEQRAADPAGLGRYFRRQPVDCLKIAPSHLAALQGSPYFDRIMPRRLLVLGGEASRREWVDQLRSRAPGCRIVNHYGPTETTVGVLTHESDPGESERPSPMFPIGRPLPNVTAFVLDRRGQPVPVGVPGELYIGGVCLARGYLGQPGRTAEVFVPDPFGSEPGARLYRTGDLACFRPDGSIEFLGRLDHQVKIRGFRVEPAEIEVALSRHQAIREVVVAARPHLVAYLVFRQGMTATITELRGYLSSLLPGYMVPGTFVELDELPRLPHGKVDRGALPQPPPTRPWLDTAFVAPRSSVEQAIATIWSEVLRLERVGVDDDFFALGGHSLRAVQVIARLRSDLEVELPLSTMFEAPTVAGLALAVADLSSQAVKA